MINLGFYVDDLSDQEVIHMISKEINRARLGDKIVDASIFYNDIGPVNIPVNAGMFNSTDIWNFKGSLIVFSLAALHKALSYVNKINIYYCFGWKDFDVLDLLSCMDNDNISVVAKDEESKKNFFRVTNKPAIAIHPDIAGITDTILEQENERTANY